MEDDTWTPDKGLRKPILIDPKTNPGEYIKTYMYGLPKDPEELVEHARQIIVAYDNLRHRKLGNDQARLLTLHFEAVVWRLNDGTRFGSFEKQCWLRHRLSAPDGHVPMWGQEGRFLARAMGIRFLVRYRGLEGAEGNYLNKGHTFDVTVVDVLAPFISNTGFAAFTNRASWENGGTVEEAVTRALTEHMTSAEYLARTKNRRILLGENERNKRLEQQASDPAFGEGGWIKVAPLPFFTGDAKPVQLGLGGKPDKPSWRR
jgi:hypothetical protein